MPRRPSCKVQELRLSTTLGLIRALRESGNVICLALALLACVSCGDVVDVALVGRRKRQGKKRMKLWRAALVRKGKRSEFGFIADARALACTGGIVVILRHFGRIV